ncbi:MAG: 16S rRNA (adenine(1518)-N(6)/adenine(1519)-N(6))-dimethyltransferase RsmA [Proteobacteria bacterium]|nr:16S rRNA (adenine(1518)-N(6)/adenine(1519)-N(6))-dimethyltransferase RsmA [Pseudomonadota bacterium]
MSAAAGPDGLPPLREVIERYGLNAKKSLGQNFLLDLNLTRKIARLAGDLSDRTVVEIGPGPGGLTRALLIEGAKQVIAIERDDRCLPALADIGERFPGRLEVHPADALDIDWRQLLGGKSASIIANLPYGVASMLLVNWLETEPWPPWYDRMILMFQREVAERIVALPNSKAYGRLSILAQWRTRPTIVMNLPPDAFTPPPKVASAIVDFRPIENPEPACKVKTLACVTAAAFGQRRKMLRSSLKQLTAFPELLLQRTGIAPERRAEDLTVAEFARLALALDESRAAPA